MQLLLAGLQSSSLSLTHLLMGFDVAKGPEGSLFVNSRVLEFLAPVL